jgi:hypothetical protein
MVNNPQSLPAGRREMETVLLVRKAILPHALRDPAKNSSIDVAKELMVRRVKFSATKSINKDFAELR